jgi:hypothetical protein
MINPLYEAHRMEHGIPYEEMPGADKVRDWTGPMQRCGAMSAVAVQAERL